MNSLRVLIIGGGGREHALAWAISRSPYCRKLYVAPGNAGTRELAESLALNPDDHQAVVNAVAAHHIDFTIIGPEQPLVDGLAETLRSHGYVAFGPDREAARLEGSKAFAKTVMEEAGVPTAGWREFEASRLHEARDYALNHPLPVVIKADGLASGKGVIIAESAGEIEALFDRLKNESEFGEAASRIVIEEYMEGEEASVFVLTDGEEIKVWPAVQDHKRMGEGDTGPNTGGMGAYLPAPVVDQATMGNIKNEIIHPVLRRMRERGMPYSGVLYAGLMISPQGPKVVEFNCRFGDPECQVLMPAVNEDVLPVLYDTATGNLESGELDCTEDYVSCVMLASEGYPGSYEKGKVISGLEFDEDDIEVFHSATREEGGNLVSDGGRVLGVTGRGSTLREALGRTYSAVHQIHFDGMYYRKDIGHTGLKYFES